MRVYMSWKMIWTESEMLNADGKKQKIMELAVDAICEWAEDSTSQCVQSTSEACREIMDRS